MPVELWSGSRGLDPGIELSAYRIIQRRSTPLHARGARARVVA
jgi:hypothetical protein